MATTKTNRQELGSELAQRIARKLTEKEVSADELARRASDVDQELIQARGDYALYLHSLRDPSGSLIENLGAEGLRIYLVAVAKERDQLRAELESLAETQKKRQQMWDEVSAWIEEHAPDATALVEAREKAIDVCRRVRDDSQRVIRQLTEEKAWYANRVGACTENEKKLQTKVATLEENLKATRDKLARLRASRSLPKR
jgi:chromosome segregation ATPase